MVENPEDRFSLLRLIYQSHDNFCDLFFFFLLIILNQTTYRATNYVKNVVKFYIYEHCEPMSIPLRIYKSCA